MHGNWKTLLRLHDGDSLTAVPVFLPADQAIPAKEVPARAQFTREFIADHEILQREQKAAAAGLRSLAYLVVLAIALALLALLAWGLHRLAGAVSRRTRPRPRRARPPRATEAGRQPCLTWRSLSPTTRWSRRCPSSCRCW